MGGGGGGRGGGGSIQQQQSALKYDHIAFQPTSLIISSSPLLLRHSSSFCQQNNVHGPWIGWGKEGGGGARRGGGIGKERGGLGKKGGGDGAKGRVAAAVGGGVADLRVAIDWEGKRRGNGK